MSKSWINLVVSSLSPWNSLGRLTFISLGAGRVAAGAGAVVLDVVADMFGSSCSDSVSSSDSSVSSSDSVSVVPSDTDPSVNPSLAGASCAGSKNSADPSEDSESGVGARKVRRLVDVMSYQGSGSVSVSFAGPCPCKGSGFWWVWSSKPREVDGTKSLIFC
jgi:hypothetical protein